MDITKIVAILTEIETYATALLKVYAMRNELRAAEMKLGLTPSVADEGANAKGFTAFEVADSFTEVSYMRGWALIAQDSPDCIASVRHDLDEKATAYINWLWRTGYAEDKRFVPLMRNLVALKMRLY